MFTDLDIHLRLNCTFTVSAIIVLHMSYILRGSSHLKNRGLSLPPLHLCTASLLRPDSVLMSLAVIPAWLSHTHSHRVPWRSASSFNTHTFWWAQLILKKHSSVRHCCCPPLRSFSGAPQKIYIEEREWVRQIDTSALQNILWSRLVPPFDANSSECRQEY